MLALGWAKHFLIHTKYADGSREYPQRPRMSVANDSGDGLVSPSSCLYQQARKSIYRRKTMAPKHSSAHPSRNAFADFSFAVRSTTLADDIVAVESKRVLGIAAIVTIADFTSSSNCSRPGINRVLGPASFRLAGFSAGVKPAPIKFDTAAVGFSRLISGQISPPETTAAIPGRSCLASTMYQATFVVGFKSSSTAFDPNTILRGTTSATASWAVRFLVSSPKTVAGCYRAFASSIEAAVAVHTTTTMPPSKKGGRSRAVRRAGAVNSGPCAHGSGPLQSFGATL